jgi:hypothetical protein
VAAKPHPRNRESPAAGDAAVRTGEGSERQTLPEKCCHPEETFGSIATWIDRLLTDIMLVTNTFSAALRRLRPDS